MKSCRLGLAIDILFVLWFLEYGWVTVDGAIPHGLTTWKLRVYFHLKRQVRKNIVARAIIWVEAPAAEAGKLDKATMRHHCLLVFTGESTFQGFSGGAGFRPSTVLCGTAVSWDLSCLEAHILASGPETALDGVHLVSASLQRCAHA